MNDVEIIDLYLQRSESAINETSLRYKSYCTAIAMNILHNHEDAAECVADTFLQMWNSIPPEKPVKLSSFIGRITRNISLNKYEAKNAQKRGNNETFVLLSELDSCVASDFNVDERVDFNNLSQEINDFLSTVKKEDRLFFVGRYWYGYCVREIASQFNCGESKVRMSIHRTRKKLKTYLEKRGVVT